MGSCFSRKKTQTTQLDSSSTLEETQLDSSFSLEETQLDSSLSLEETQLDSSFPTEEPEPEYIGMGWFDLPYDIRRMIIDLLDMDGKHTFLKCSVDCNEEVTLSQNCIDEIVIYDKGIGKNRHIGIFVHGIGEEYHYIFADLSYGNDYICRWMNKEISFTRIFDTQDLIEITLRYFNFIVRKNTKSLKSVIIQINDFPYNQTNINKLRNKHLEKLKLFENENGIDPISCGFVDFDTISRFHDFVEIPNCQLSDLFKIKSEIREVINPIFSMDDFDEFVRRLLIEEEDEELGKHLTRIRVDLKEIDIRSNVIRIIQKYTGFSVEDADEGREGIKYVRFWRKSKKWENREHYLVLKTKYLLYRTNEI